jgi:beta-galactosidase
MSIFNIQASDFFLDGKPFRILSGAMHYFRVPRLYWEDRLHKARLMGLNTIETYVAWNLHEPRPGQFHFGGNLDVRAYIEAAAQEGLKVILRPGPYICSEWDFGGLPAWLLKDPGMRVRCAYPPYLAAVDRFFTALLPPLADLQVSRGGPIIMVQIENEYGSYGDDKTYLTHLRDSLQANGFEGLFFTSDGEAGRYLEAGTLEGVHATVNFGNYPERAFRRLREFQPKGPLMCTEFWNGWFDYWGFWHQKRSAARKAKIYERMLRAGASVNLYMWHGGTNFGFMNGANALGNRYLADVTSYDYDAPLSECGDLTEKYHALRKIIRKYALVPDEPLPPPMPRLDLGVVPVTGYISLWEALPSLAEPIRLSSPEPMETLDQNYGFILYRTHLHGPKMGKLSIRGLHDRAQVFVDGKHVGILNRNRPGKKLALSLPSGSARLDILVENMGRVNFGPQLMDRKGILDGVLLGGHYLFDWEIFRLPLEDLSRLVFSPVMAQPNYPAFFCARFQVDKPLDTLLALPGWTKGVAWVNGFNLGRYWKIGPQRRLYVPAPLLREGENELVIFELYAAKKIQVELRGQPGF